MSLEASLQAAVTAEKLLPSALENINSLLAASTNPLYRTAITQLVKDEQWEELNDRFFETLRFGTGGLRGRTIGKVVTKAERAGAGKKERPVHPCVGTASMNFYNLSRATRGLVAYILKWRKQKKLKGRPSIVFAHDTRHFSADFAKFCAKIAMKHGVDVQLFDGPRATPEMPGRSRSSTARSARPSVRTARRAPTARSRWPRSSPAIA